MSDTQFKPALLILDQGSYLLLAVEEGKDYRFFGPDGRPVDIANVMVAKSITHPGWEFDSALGRVVVDATTEEQTIDGRPMDDVWNSFEEFDINFAADGSQVTVARR